MIMPDCRKSNDGGSAIPEYYLGQSEMQGNIGGLRVCSYASAEAVAGCDSNNIMRGQHYASRYYDGEGDQRANEPLQPRKI